MDPAFGARLEAVAELVMGEVNVKAVEPLAEDSAILTKRLKGGLQKAGSPLWKTHEAGGWCHRGIGTGGHPSSRTQWALGHDFGRRPQWKLLLDDVEVQTEDIPGWLVAGEGGVTVALDIDISPELRKEGLARELVNRIQQQRKDAGLEVTDRIALTLEGPEELQESVASNLDYIRAETLANELTWGPTGPGAKEEELEPQMTVAIAMVAIQ